MSSGSRLTEVFRSSAVIPFDNASKIVLISDCHRGDGSYIDNFSNNQNIYYAALKHYFSNGYTYIELGDCDELWKNRSFADINKIYVDIFRLLSRFHSEGRLHLICGNHDIEKLNPKFGKEQMNRFYDSHTGLYEPLFDEIKVHEGIKLLHCESEREIFLVHGHQASLLDSKLWRVGRFLVRHILRRLEMVGFKDITSAAKNNIKKHRVERRITRWAERYNRLVIAGHTHRPVCSPDPSSLYYNDGSGVHPNCITCIELANGEISLYKWRVKTREDGSLFVDRQLIAVPRKL